MEEATLLLGREAKWPWTNNRKGVHSVNLLKPYSATLLLNIFLT